MSGWAEVLGPLIDGTPSAQPNPPESREAFAPTRGTAYGRKALEQACEVVASTPEGARNDTLNKEAHSIAGLVASGEISSVEAARDALIAAGVKSGLPEGDARKTVASAFKAGLQKPRRPRPREPRNGGASRNRPAAANGKAKERVSDRSSAEPWAPRDSDAPDAPPSSERPLELRAHSIADVLSRWKAEGPLVHEPTGIKGLDDLTGGGPVYGTRWYIPGAPDAGKTALLVQIAHTFALRVRDGLHYIEVGLHAVDEEDGDLVTRVAQRKGYKRDACEIRDPSELVSMLTEIGDLPITFYDDNWTIESAAADLAERAKTNGRRAFLGVDSIQTVTCDAHRRAALEGKELSEAAAVTANVRALRAVTTKHRLIGMATSELARGAYRSSDPAQQTSILAGSKWSGAIEYSGRVILGLRSVPDEQDIIDIELAKNKHRPPGADRDKHVFVRIDRRSQVLSEVNYDPPPKPTAADRDEKKRGAIVQDAAAVARVLLAQPGLPARKFRAAAMAATAFGVDRYEVAVGLLGAAVVKGKGPNNSTPLTLALELVPEQVRRAMEASK